MTCFGLVIGSAVSYGGRNAGCNLNIHLCTLYTSIHAKQACHAPVVLYPSTRGHLTGASCQVVCLRFNDMEKVADNKEKKNLV